MSWVDEHRLHCDLQGCEHVSPAREVTERNYLPKPWVQAVIEAEGRTDSRIVHFCHAAHYQRWQALQQQAVTA